VSSRADEGDDGVTTGTGAAVGALRNCAGSVCVTRARSAASLVVPEAVLVVPANAASLITTAGVDGSSFGMYGLAGVVTPRANEPDSGELAGGGGSGAGGAGGAEMSTTGAVGTEVATTAAGGAETVATGAGGVETATTGAGGAEAAATGATAAAAAGAATGGAAGAVGVAAGGAMGEATGAATGPGAGASSTGAAGGGCEGPTTIGAMPRSVCFCRATFGAETSAVGV
jgi:hypothetical protein